MPDVNLMTWQSIAQSARYYQLQTIVFADHSLFFIGLRLKRGQSEHFICEGCKIRGLKRDDRGKLYLLRDVGGVEVLKRFWF